MMCTPINGQPSSPATRLHCLLIVATEAAKFPGKTLLFSSDHPFDNGVDDPKLNSYPHQIFIVCLFTKPCATPQAAFIGCEARRRVLSCLHVLSVLKGRFGCVVPGVLFIPWPLCPAFLPWRPRWDSGKTQTQVCAQGSYIQSSGFI